MVQSTIALGFLFATLLIGGFFCYIYVLKRQSYLLLWTFGWILYALHYIPAALSPWFWTSPLLATVNHSLFGIAGIAFFLGTQLYTRRKPWIVPAIIAAVFVAAWAALNDFHLFDVSSFVLSSLFILPWLICSGRRA